MENGQYGRTSDFDGALLGLWRCFGAQIWIGGQLGITSSKFNGVSVMSRGFNRVN